jgi:hypothetical protein
LFEDDESKTLNDEQQEDLLAIGPYLDWSTTNCSIDITSRTRDHFEFFIGAVLVPIKPAFDNTTTDRPAPATTVTDPTSTKYMTVKYVIRPPPPTFTPLADEPLMIAEKMWDRPDKIMTAATMTEYGEQSLRTNMPPTPGRMKDTGLPHKTVATTDLPRQNHTAATSCPTDTIPNDRFGKTMDAGEMFKDTGEQPSLLTNTREMKFVEPLEDDMRKQEAAHKIISDRTQAEDNICKKVATRSFVISDHGFPSESTKTAVSLTIPTSTPRPQSILWNPPKRVLDTASPPRPIMPQAIVPPRNHPSIALIPLQC